MKTLSQIQSEVAVWSAENFPGKKSYQPLLGVGEETGELMHAHLKAEQGIRGNEDHYSKKVDAVADIVIYLMDYCHLEGIDLQVAVEQTWESVKQRNWKKNPIDGK